MAILSISRFPLKLRNGSPDEDIIFILNLEKINMLPVTSDVIKKFILNDPELMKVYSALLSGLQVQTFKDSIEKLAYIKTAFLEV